MGSRFSSLYSFALIYTYVNKQKNWVGHCWNGNLQWPELKLRWWTQTLPRLYRIHMYTINISEKRCTFTWPALRNSLVFPNCEQEALVFSQYSSPNTTLRIAAQSLRVWSPLDKPVKLTVLFTNIASSRSSVESILWAHFLLHVNQVSSLEVDDYIITV